MVEILTLCLLVLLVVAVIGLFAIMGELNSRIPAPADTDLGPAIWPVERARTGPLSDWPTALDEVAGSGGVVVVFSTSCATCRKILREEPNQLGYDVRTAVVVVAPDEESGRAFADEHPVLARVPVHVDPEGAWLREAVGLESSPAVFTVGDGRVQEVFNFNRSSALAGLVSASAEEARNA